MKNTWKWIFGFLLTLLVLVILPLTWRTILPFNNYQMMGYGWHMPMMVGGYGMMGVGMLFFWLILLALLVFIGFGIALLVKALTAQNNIK